LKIDFWFNVELDEESRLFGAEIHRLDVGEKEVSTPRFSRTLMSQPWWRWPGEFLIS